MIVDMLYSHFSLFCSYLYKRFIRTLFSITPRDYNSFGSRRGNDAVMVRGTFNHVHLNNKLVSKRASSLLPSSPSPATTTLYLPTNIEMDIFDASEHYRTSKTPLIILAGKNYGCGPSRDWVTKGPWMLVCQKSTKEKYAYKIFEFHLRVFVLYLPKVLNLNIVQI